MSDPVDVDRTREMIAEAVRCAGLAAAIRHEQYKTVDGLPLAYREKLTIHGALAYLMGHGFLVPGPTLLAEQEWVSLDIPEPYRLDFGDAVRDAVASHARVMGALDRRSGR